MKSTDILKERLNASDSAIRSNWNNIKTAIAKLNNDIVYDFSSQNSTVKIRSHIKNLVVLLDQMDSNLQDKFTIKSLQEELQKNGQ